MFSKFTRSISATIGVVVCLVNLGAAAEHLLPMRVSGIEVGEGANHCAVQGRYCFVAAGSSGFVVLDISDPSKPKQIGRCSTRRPAEWISLGNGLAWVSEESDGAELIDLSNPEQPLPVGFIENFSAGARSVFVGNKLYVAQGGLYVFDIGNPASPERMGAYNFPVEGEDQPLNRLQSIAVRGDFAYCGDGPILWVFDVSDAAHPKPSNFLAPDDGDIIDIAISGSALFTAARWGYLQTYDIADPVHPQWLGSHFTYGMTSSIRISQERVFATIENHGFHTFEISQRTNLQHIGFYPSKSEVRNVATVGNVCFLAQVSNGVSVVDLVPANPVIRGDAWPESERLDVRAGIALLGAWGSIRVVDVSDPQSTHVVGSLKTGMGFPDNIAIGDGFACYVSNYGDINDGGPFRTIDLRVPSNPKRLGSYVPSSLIWDLALRGSYAYLATDTEGLVIMNLADPSQPERVGSLPTTDQPVSIAIGNDTAYLAASSAGVLIVNIRDPFHPSLVGQHKTVGKAERVTVSGDYCYVAEEGGRLSVLNISRREAPRSVGSYPSATRISKMLVNDGFLYVLSSVDVLEVIDVSDPSLPRRVGGDSAPYPSSIHIASDHNSIWVSGYGPNGLVRLAPFGRLRVTSEVGMQDGTISLRVYGLPGDPVTIERSPDLGAWIEWQTVTLGEIPARIIDAKGQGTPDRAFYRTSRVR